MRRRPPHAIAASLMRSPRPCPLGAPRQSRSGHPWAPWEEGSGSARACDEVADRADSITVGCPAARPVAGPCDRDHPASTGVTCRSGVEPAPGSDYRPSGGRPRRDRGSARSCRWRRVAGGGVAARGGTVRGAAPPLSVERLDDRIVVRVDDRTFTCYRFGAGQKYPYFYPVNGPRSGVSVTTESSLPWPHHRSLFFGSDKVNGGNYWQEGNDQGQIVSRGPPSSTPAPTAS